MNTLNGKMAKINNDVDFDYSTIIPNEYCLKHYIVISSTIIYYKILLSLPNESYDKYKLRYII